MNINDLPKTGSLTINGIDFDWEKSGQNHLIVSRHAEADNPHYEAEVGFPGGVIDLEQVDSWDVAIATVDQDGGEGWMDEDYIDQFDSFFAELVKKYGTPAETR